MRLLNKCRNTLLTASVVIAAQFWAVGQPWIVPPAGDEVAAPRSQPTSPLSARGKIVDEVSTGDGYVLQANTGEKHLIVPSMLLEDPTADALAALARLPNATYMIHGHTDSKGTNARAFSSSRCAFVYRTAP